MTTLRAAAAFAVLLLACAAAAKPAFAFPPAEEDMLQAAGQSLMKGIMGTKEEAAALCDAGKAALGADAPAYVLFHYERCLALAAAPDTGPEGPYCTHYKQAVAIWAKSPPPVDRNAEDDAIFRSKMLREAKEEVAEKCGANGPVAATKDDPLMQVIPPTPGATLRTAEGIAYKLPDGFGVKDFDPDSGLAFLTNKAQETLLRVERTSRNDESTRNVDYPEHETLASGAAFDWKYIEFIPGAGSHVLYARVTLPAAYVVLGIVTTSKTTKSVDKEMGLAAFRVIANSVRIVGPRCLGECKPGSLTK